jgi:hypothetical protein
MATQTLRIHGLSEDTLRRIDEKARRNGRDREDYIRELIARDLDEFDTGATPPVLELFAPVQQEFTQLGMTEADLDAVITDAREKRLRDSGAADIA